MIQPHTLTLDDVSFDKSTGSIEVYEGKYKHIIIPDNFEGVPVTEIDDYASVSYTHLTLPTTR